MKLYGRQWKANNLIIILKKEKIRTSSQSLIIQNINTVIVSLILPLNNFNWFRSPLKKQSPRNNPPWQIPAFLYTYTCYRRSIMPFTPKHDACKGLTIRINVIIVVFFLSK
jgi:hypothetical protein